MKIYECDQWNRIGLKYYTIKILNEMIFVFLDLKKLWMKWMRRKRLESDWIDEWDKELNAGDTNFASSPW